jgi:CxxC motif-containing protein (DUF1111 family)
MSPAATKLAGVLLLTAATVPPCNRDPMPGGPLAGLTPEELDRFERGRAVFQRVFTPEDGLGPLFNANACAECHEDPAVGGLGDEIEVHATAALEAALQAAAGVPSEDTAPAIAGCDLLLERGGPVYQLHVTAALGESLGIDREPIPPGATIGRRTSPDVFGMGLLDAVPDSLLLALADPEDADGDGVSGRVNHFLDGRIGRFGRKALVPTLAEFNAAAFQIEQGITTFAALDEGTVGGAPLPPGVDPAADPELRDEDVRLAIDFVRFLAPPAPRPMGPLERAGEKLFASVGCAACHVPVLETGPNRVAALSRQPVRAYTDLLLHDMGPDLADLCFGEAAPAEFRTEPLMGLRFATAFLHDGRAASIDQAVRLHGGEAAAARAAYAALVPRDRERLLAFLKGL